MHAAAAPAGSPHNLTLALHTEPRPLPEAQPAPDDTMRQLSAFATDLRLAIGERDAALEEAARAARARDRFFREAPRQFRAPLRALEALIGELVGQVAPGQARTVDTMQRLIEHVQGLVDAIEAQRATGLVGSEPARPCASGDDLAKLLTAMAERHGPVAHAKGLRLRTRQRGAPAVDGWPVDSARLGRLVDLLVDNAVRHTPEGDVDLVLQFSARGGARIHVLDTGRPNDPSDFAPLLDEVPDAPALPAPRGVGLFRASALADQLGCRIDVYRMPDRGTRLTIRLPRADGAGDEPSAPAGDSGNGVFDSGAQLVRLKKDVFTLTRERARSDDALQRAQLDGLMRLVAAAELKDDDTGVHIVRMGWFSALIARSLGKSSRYCEMLLVASRMHDVGKIGVPDSILQKRGPLTPDEWSVMRRHPEIGATLLRGTQIPMYDMAAEVALCHHEKFDGSGYPNRLAGEDIPLAARIVALADFFDAVTMDRCYRPAMTDEKAFELIHQSSGNHFDPTVVDAFFRAVPELLDTRDRVNRGLPVAL